MELDMPNLSKTLTGLNQIVTVLQSRYDRFCYAEYHSEAGCGSEGSPENLDIHNAYVFEPRFKARTAKEIRALILVIATEGFRMDALYPLLVELQERIVPKKEPVFLPLKISLQFLIDRRFNETQPIKEAIQAILGYHLRSYRGNDLRIAAEILRRTSLKIRALQRSKVKRLGTPKRPKERAEPAHTWLPGWQIQYIPRKDYTNDEEVIPIWEILSPVEVLHHYR